VLTTWILRKYLKYLLQEASTMTQKLPYTLSFSFFLSFSRFLSKTTLSLPRSGGVYGKQGCDLRLMLSLSLSLPLSHLKLASKEVAVLMFV
jgi:hypothetical protein